MNVELLYKLIEHYRKLGDEHVPWLRDHCAAGVMRKWDGESTSGINGDYIAAKLQIPHNEAEDIFWGNIYPKSGSITGNDVADGLERTKAGTGFRNIP